MRLRLRTPVVVLLVLAAACTDDDAALPSDPTTLGPAEVVMGAAQEDELFAFHPPISDPQTFAGTFNPDLRPSIVVCDATDPTCTNDDPTDDVPLVTFSPEDITVDLVEQLYRYDWDTGKGNPALRPTSGVVYRVHVVVQNIQVGFHDVLPTDNGSSGQGTEDLHAFNNGATLPIKFRIDVGAICRPDGTVVIDCNEAVIDLNAGGTVAIDEGGVEFEPGTQTSNGDDFVLVIVEQLNETNPNVNCFEAAPGGGLDIPQFGPCVRVTTDPEIDGLSPLAVVSLCVELDATSLPVTELQEQLIQIHKVDEDTGEVMALENVPENVCDTGTQTGLLEGLPDHPVLRYASLGWRTVKRAVLPRPLVAADIGFGGAAPGFSNFRWALPATLNPLPGTDGQVAAAGTPVTNDPGVLVLDGYGDPVQGATVRFTVVGGGGSVAAAEVVTGADGIASSQGWTLGTGLGTNTLEAGGLGYQSALDAQSHHFELDVDPQAAVFTATASGPPNAFAVQGDGQTGEVAQPLAAPIVVTLSDVNGVPLAGESVTWSVSDGSLDVTTSTTDAAGQAQAVWTLGTTAGSQTGQVSATAPDGTIITASFAATAEPAAPAGFDENDGGDQGEATAGDDLPLSVTVEDAYGNTVPGVSVTWTVGDGGGSFAGDGSVTATTLPDGTVAVTWTLGTTASADGSPNNTATATITLADGSQITVTFTATGVAGPAASIALVSGNGQSGTVGTTLAADVVVRVADQYGNAVAGHAVAWSTGDGGTVTSSGSTAADGSVSGSWTLGTTAGTQTALASSSVGTVPLSAEAVPDVPATVLVAGGDGQTAGPGQTLPDPISVTVEDQYQNPVPGATVGWAVTSGGGSVSPASSVTDGSGAASASWTLGVVEGGNGAAASVAGVSAPATFTATASCGGGGFGTATVDGQLGGAEWTCARSEAFVANLNGSKPATVYWMNDGTNLYMALEVEPPEAFELLLDFDNDGDGVPQAGDDMLAFDPATGSYLDRYLTARCADRSQAGCGDDDTAAGGSQDGAAAVGSTGATYVYEVVKPLASGDIGFDFDLLAPDAVGFFLTLRSGNGAKGNTQWPGFREYRRITVEEGF